MSAKVVIAWQDEQLVLIKEPDVFYDSAEAALSTEIEKIEDEMEPWKAEALAALQPGVDVYRGGGILKLAELMRKLSNCKMLRATHRRLSPQSRGTGGAS